MPTYSKTFNGEQEALLLSLFVTEPYADVFGVYDTLLPPEQFATLGAAYSRTHERFQSRLMKAIEDGDLLDREIIQSVLTVHESRKHLENVAPADEVTGKAIAACLAMPEFISTLNSFKSVPKKAGLFIQKWAQEYGHNSIKEMGMLRFCCEDIPDYTGKHITGHPLSHPQVKSSRYIDWSNILHLAEENLDVTSSKHADAILETLRAINAAYVSLSDKCQKALTTASINRDYMAYQLGDEQIAAAVKKIVAGKQKKDPAYAPAAAELADLAAKERRSREEAFEKDARRSIFDTTRYILTPAMPTSLACSVDARSMEDILTDMLSSSMQADQKIGGELWKQVRMLQPVLLGEKCHAGRSPYEVETNAALEAVVKEMFGFERERQYEITERTNYIKLGSDEMFSDTQLAAAIAYPHGHGSFMQYYSALKGNKTGVQRIIDAAFAKRGKYDPVPADLGQGGLLREFLMDYGGYRDVFRHRRGARTRQRLNTFHGFETPALIPVAGLAAEYDEVNRLADRAFRKIVDRDPYAAQLIVPFSYKCRSLYSWSVQQDIYFSELRGRPTANDSYRTIAWDIAEYGKKAAPEVWKHIAIDRKTYPPEITLQARKWYDDHRRGD